MVGQEAIVRTLRNQVSTDRIAHAYLFCGSRGTGKTSTAKILARAINCDHPDNGDPCMKCENCKRSAEESLDVVEIDAASNNGVDSIRDLRETVKYPPQFGKYKVYIIDEVHMLSAGAFNALLKTLEEPPAHVVFILATTEPQKLPATILSRCQRFDFGRIPAEKIQVRLREVAEGCGAEYSNGALMAIARAAEGGMRDALSIMDMCIGTGNKLDEALVRSVLGTSDRDFLFRFSDAIAREDASDLFRLIDQAMREGKDPIVLAKDVSEHLRYLLITRCCGEGMEHVLDLTEEDADEYRRSAEAFTVSRLMSVLDCFMGVETGMRYSNRPRLLLETAALKACVRTTEPDSRALTDRMDELEKKIEDLVRNGVRVSADAAPAGLNNEEKKKKKAAEIKTTEAGKPTETKPVSPGGSAQEIWNTAENMLKKTDPAIFSFLKTGGRFIGCEGNIYIWQAQTGMEYMARSLNTPARMEKITEALTSAAGCPSTFRADDRKTETDTAEEKSDEQYLQSIYETFGEAAVDIREN